MHEEPETLPNSMHMITDDTRLAPKQPIKSFRVEITLNHSERRMDHVLLNKLRNQEENLTLRNISRIAFKELFKKKRIRIKGQAGRPSSSLAQGTTWVDILGFE